MVDHPVELEGQRADGTLFPVEIAITQPELDGPPLFTGYVRDVTDRRRADEELRALAAEQAALRRVATLVASEGDPADVFSAVTEEVGRLLGAHSANMVRYEQGDEAIVVGGWSARGDAGGRGRRARAARRRDGVGARVADGTPGARRLLRRRPRRRSPSASARSASAVAWPRRSCSRAGCGAR